MKFSKHHFFSPPRVLEIDKKTEISYLPRLLNKNYSVFLLELEYCRRSYRSAEIDSFSDFQWKFPYEISVFSSEKTIFLFTNYSSIHLQLLSKRRKFCNEQCPLDIMLYFEQYDSDNQK